MPHRFRGSPRLRHDRSDRQGYEPHRAVLRYPVTDYVGYSGGTWLGAYYQKYFPTRVGRFVLDSNADFTKPWDVTFGAQPQSFQRRFEKDFEPWAAKYDSTFHLGATASGVNGFYEKLRRDLVRKPLVITDGVNTVTVDGNAFDTAIISTLYSEDHLPVARVFLRTVRDQWDAARADGRGRSPRADRTRGEGQPGGRREPAALG